MSLRNRIATSAIPEVNEYVGELLASVAVVQTLHWQVTPDALALHKALEYYYDNIPDLLDKLVETYQGGADKIVRNYFKGVNLENEQVPAARQAPLGP